ncbi:MAG: helix-turn-helix domain-containing protein [Bacteroidota bacterium]
MNPKIDQARHLYLNCAMTQRDIAAKVGVSERTIFNWIRQFAWERLKRAAYQAPAMIAENLCSQLVELQSSIAAREPGNRFPTKDEAEITRKLLTGLDKVKKYPSKSQTLQVFTLFRDFLRKSYGKDAARAFGMQMMSFLDNDPVNGYQPYEMEFGADKISPITPCYDEDFEEEISKLDPVGEATKISFAEPEIHPAISAETIDNTGIEAPVASAVIPAKVGSKSEIQLPPAHTPPLPPVSTTDSNTAMPVEGHLKGSELRETRPGLLAA